MAIEKDKVVSLNFILRDAKTNEVLEDNSDFNPISFLLGRGQILESLEEEIAKLNEGDESDILITSDKAWKSYDDSLIQELPKEQFAGIDLNVGMELFGENEDGSSVRVVVKEIKNDSVVIDYNHPYAGKDLLFTINIKEVRDASEEELASGAAMQAGGCGCGGHGHGHDHGHGGGCCGGHGGGGCGCHDEEEEHHHHHHHGHGG
ncbi:peptidylprolyl isomerase [Campylobacter canadensis]|uniref:FKBP-type peptidyl-prolyl cis-trans isomerase n=1 Tax=Campylobacter canadensis TaxID=449520 RepID=UPI001551B7D2|nr:peptidylprolyl isomerase [Campylobacter canadensis]MBZ7994761.1 peptidylprolyl isomerase [Campylobacter canadensis]MBZ7996531.1 peptidylprolyl isomerase [Campylobacter canadensis]MBZ8000187.1 peptidylprolyl isomerase [Campylobacter canadensis]MBZ8001856.1 peptidylprolyl isomerase [Campylobacter canadensis]MBZ8004146.1 peptidylprolyl isomerase [Campylobacter canadensis]